MTRQEIHDTVRKLLSGWAVRCERNHALPVVLLASGQDGNEGALVVLLPKNLPQEYVIEMLRTAADQMAAAPDRN